MWNEIQDELSAHLNSLASSIPSIVHALIILIGGWLLAKIIQWIVFKLSHVLGIERVAKESGVQKFLERKGFKKGFSGLAANLFFWMIMLIILVRFFEIIGLDIVSNLLNQLAVFLPNVLLSLVIMIVGFYLAGFLSGLLSESLEDKLSPEYRWISKLVFLGIAVLTVGIALSQFGIGELIIVNVVTIFFGAVGLAFGLAFGLGGKDWASRIIEKYFPTENGKDRSLD